MLQYPSNTACCCNVTNLYFVEALELALSLPSFTKKSEDRQLYLEIVAANEVWYRHCRSR